MVTVPHNPLPRTTPSSQKLAQFNVDYSGIAQAGKAIGGALADFGAAREVSRERKVESQRFDTLTKFSEFETNIKTELSKLQQETPTDAANYFDQAESMYDNAKNGFLNDVPAEMQDEFEYRAAELRKGIIANSLDFDFTQQNLFYSNKITDELQKLKKDIDGKPGALKNAEAKIEELISASGLAEIEKEKQRRLAKAGLQAISLRDEAKIAVLNAGATGGKIAAVGLPASAPAVLAAIKKRESGGHYAIRYDGGKGSKISSYADHPRQRATITSGGHAGESSTAAGAYQFIETTWDTAARMAGVTDFSPASQDKAAWVWADHTAKQQTGKSIDELLATGDTASLKKALGSQWEGVRHMKQEEFDRLIASGGDGTGELLTDPRFAELDYATAEAAIADGAQSANAIITAQLDTMKAENEAKINALRVGLFDGTAGEQDIIKARADGTLTNYQDIANAYETLQKREKDGADLRTAHAMLTGQQLWVKGNADHAKAADALFNAADGANKLTQGDSNYVDQTVVPNWQKMGYAGPAMVETLMSLTRHADASKAAFAYDVLQRMRTAQPDAFNTTFTNETQAQLDAWETRKNYYGPEQLVAQVQDRGMDQATRQAKLVLKAEARDVYKEKAIGTSDFVNTLDTIFGAEPSAPVAPTARVALSLEHAALFEDNYVRSGGDVELAKRWTNEQLGRIWGTSEIGGKKQIMRLPPDKVGYRKFNGDYNWIGEQIREQFKLAPTDTFTLVSTSNTQIQYNQLQQGKTQQLPGYLIWVEDERGIPHFATTADGDVAEANAVWTTDMTYAEESAMQEKQNIVDEDILVAQYIKQHAIYVRTKGEVPVDPDLKLRYDEIIGRREQRNAEQRSGTTEILDELLGQIQQGGN